MTDDASAAPVTEAQVPATEPAPPGPAAEAPEPPPPSATPYRTAPEAVALAPFVAPRRHSLTGACVFVFGVLLWAFLIMGELTTSYAPGKHGMMVGEALAVVFVLATSGAAWGAALRRSLEASPASSPMATYARGTLLAVVPFAVWLFVLLCATALGKSASKNMDGPITSLLLIASVAAALGGRRMAGLRGPASTTRQRVLARLLWAAAGLLTLVASIEVLAS
jgi:hypothetical protein